MYVLCMCERCKWYFVLRKQVMWMAFSDGPFPNKCEIDLAIWRARTFSFYSVRLSVNIHSHSQITEQRREWKSVAAVNQDTLTSIVDRSRRSFSQGSSILSTCSALHPYLHTVRSMVQTTKYWYLPVFVSVRRYSPVFPGCWVETRAHSRAIPRSRGAAFPRTAAHCIDSSTMYR